VPIKADCIQGVKYPTLPRRTVGTDRRVRGNWPPALATRTNIAIREEHHDPFVRGLPESAVFRRPWHYSRRDILATRGPAIHWLAAAKYIDRSAYAAAIAHHQLGLAGSSEVGRSAEARAGSPATDRYSSRPDPNREAESTQRLQA
jgi:hypothetical protein